MTGTDIPSTSPNTERELQRLQKTGAFTGSIDNTPCKDTVANGV